MQRLWTFEEPFSRWVRLRKNMSKVIPTSVVRTPAHLELAEQEDLFALVYGVEEEPGHWLSVHFSLAFALAETEKFESQAFRYCADAAWSTGAQGEQAELIKFIVDERELSAEQEAYLRHRTRASLDWTRLVASGPWEGDSRVQFVRNVLARCLQSLNGTACSAQPACFQLIERAFEDEERSCRNSLPTGFLPKRILLVEGATEQILLPHFAQCITDSWPERAIAIVPAGGANQVARRYPTLRELFSIPIDCLLDGDVSSQAQTLSSQLKYGDRLYILTSGAIEEAFPRERIVSLANAYFDGLAESAIYSPISVHELDGASNQESLDRLWRKRNRGSFDKIGFAKVVASETNDAADIPSEIRDLIVDLCAYQ